MERFDTARVYLYRVLPWAPIGDPTVFVNLMWTVHGTGYRKPGWRGVPCQSIEECISAIQRVQRNPDVKDIYVCMSTQREYEVRTGDHGPYKVAKRSQENAHQMRSVFADIDVKEGAYPTTQDALKHFSQFLKDSNIPRPQLFVASGSGGFHVYWTMDKALSIAEWQPLANGLAEALRRHGVKCDTQCTVDAARVLRVPETYNSKTAPAKPVELAVKSMLPYDYTVDQMRSALAPYMGAQVIALNPKVRHELPISNLGSGIELPKAPLINIQTVADAGCSFIREALATGGASLTGNPLWNLATLTAVFTEGGREDAHRMASGNPYYNKEDTDELFDRKVREKEIKDLGWPSCQSIENAGCTSCAGCPLKNPGSRPLQFGRPTPATVDPLGELPYSYSRNPQGYIMQARKGKDEGSLISMQVSPYPVREAWIQEDPYSLHWFMKTGTKWRVIGATATQINSLEKFRTAMGDQGILLGEKRDKDFKEFIVAWMTELQKAATNTIASAPYGWVWDDSKIDGFAYGGRVWTKGADRPAGAADMEIARQYQPRGELEAWKRAAKMITSLKSPARDAILAASFAGPLVQFTGQEGLLLNAFSVGSGYGKSTTMKIAQAVWAKPSLALNGLSDTQVSVFQKATIIKHLPILWDEIKNDEQRVAFSRIGFQLSQGNDRSRSNPDASIKKRGEWNTLIIAACNDSIADVMAQQNKSTTAGVHRVFEFALDKLPFQLSGAMADQHVLTVQSNFGHAGLEYAKWLGANHDLIAKEVLQVKEVIGRKLNEEPEERFWAYSVVCLYLGAVYANKVGLTDIDTTALLKFLMETFLKNRAALTGADVDLSKERSTSSILNRFLNDMRSRHTLITDKMWTQRGKPPANGIKVLCDTARLDAIYVHHADNGHVRFSQHAFREWLEKHGYSFTAIEAYLTVNAKMAPVYCRLGAGTGIRLGQMQCFELELKDVP